jgi:plastocyanin
VLLRIFLVVSALGSLVLLVLIYAVISGLTPGTATGSESASASASAGGSAAASVAASTVPSLAPSVPASVPASAAASGAATTVTIAGLAFGGDLTVAVGTTVTWDNADAVPHTATEGTNGVAADGALFDLALDPGASASYTFTAAGTIPVTCKVHPTMNMTITVQ